MKKIMFDNHYGLEDAVLNGTKTMTRRIVPSRLNKILEDAMAKKIFMVPLSAIPDDMSIDDFAKAWEKQDSNVLFIAKEKGKEIRPKLVDYEPQIMYCAKYKVGEVVAIAQSYHALNKSGFVAPEWLEHTCESSAGYKNKMFVRADLMPHQIQITDVRVERLQDISDEDCIREGIVYDNSFPEFNDPYVYAFPVHGNKHSSTWYSPSPRIAFENLIRNMMGKKVWDNNPYVFVYSFKLIK